MCGALGEKLDTPAELAFAERLLAELTDGFPRERLGLHVCRGNWSPDESVALHGDYAPLLPILSRAPVGTLFLELCTPRAGDGRLLAQLPREKRIGIGAVNQKRAEVETPDEICARIGPLVELLGPERVLLNPDCGFATFADNPLASASIAQRKLTSIVEAAAQLRVPTLVQIADFDRSAPPQAAAKAAFKARAEVRHYPCDHFDVWPGKAWFDAASAHQVAFLTRVLG